MSEALSRVTLRAFCDEIEKVALAGKVMGAMAKRPLATAAVGGGLYVGGKGAIKGYRESSTFGSLPGKPSTTII